ncbi:MAG: PH domain-containing protein [Nocardioides sp.]
MPAGSDPLTLPHTWRPLGVRLAATFFGVLLLVVCIAAWLTLDPETRSRFSLLQRGTLILLGLAGFAAGFALARSRVVAETSRLVVVNGYRRREYEWAEVLAVHLPPGAPWVVLDLADGTSAPAMGIQGSDGDRARMAVRQLRSLLNH